MIRPAGFASVVFGDASDGDPRIDPAARRRFGLLGIPPGWTWARQVHGSEVLVVDGPGVAGKGDGLLTRRPHLALVVATADCVPVIIEGDRSAAVVHAGWRGLVAGVVAAGVAAFAGTGDRPRRAAIGPSIGPCCYEVGPEVSEVLARFAATTSWGTASVDLWDAAQAQLGDLEVWRADLCTFTDGRFLSHRRDRTVRRQVSVTWVPPN